MHVLLEGFKFFALYGLSQYLSTVPSFKLQTNFICPLLADGRIKLLLLLLGVWVN